MRCALPRAVGYGRVSTRDQHAEAQHDALDAAGCEPLFIDKACGKLARRPELDKALILANRSGDQLVADSPRAGHAASWGRMSTQSIENASRPLMRPNRCGPTGPTSASTSTAQRSTRARSSTGSTPRPVPTRLQLPVTEPVAADAMTCRIPPRRQRRWTARRKGRPPMPFAFSLGERTQSPGKSGCTTSRQNG